MTSGRHNNAAVGPVPMAGQQTVNGNVLVQRFLVDAARTQFELCALLKGGSQQAGEPSQRNDHAPAVVEVDPSAVVVEAHRFN